MKRDDILQGNCTGGNEDEDGAAAAADGEDEINECEKALAELETIDDELDDIGIILVTTEDTEIAGENGGRKNINISRLQKII